MWYLLQVIVYWFSRKTVRVFFSREQKKLVSSTTNLNQPKVGSHARVACDALFHFPEIFLCDKVGCNRICKIDNSRSRKEGDVSFWPLKMAVGQKGRIPCLFVRVKIELWLLRCCVVKVSIALVFALEQYFLDAIQIWTVFLISDTQLQRLCALSLDNNL